MSISAKLSNADNETTLWRVQSLPFKDPTITLILNLMMGFGVGAFYVGKIEYAVTQLICYLILIPLCVIVEFSDSVGLAMLFCLLTFILLGLFIAGVINARKWTFEYNYKSLQKFAQRYKSFLAVIAILGLVFIVLLFWEQIPIPIGCPFKIITGIPCPGCGGIRATQFLLKGEIVQALYINPLSCFFCLFCAVIPFWSFYDCYKNKQTLKMFLTKKWSNETLIIIGIILLANWIWNIIKGL